MFKIKLYLPYLILFLFATGHAQSWQFVGQQEFSNTATSARLAFSPTGVPYIVYQDADFSNRSRVVSFDGTAWQDLGTVSTAAADSESIAFDPNDNSVWVAHALNGARQVFMYRYDGSNWQSRSLSGNSSSNRYNKHLGLHYVENFGNPYMEAYKFPALSAASGSAQAIGSFTNFINNNVPGSGQGYSSTGRNNTIAVDKYGNLLTNQTNDDVFTSFLRLNGKTVNSRNIGTLSYQAKHYAIAKNRVLLHTRDFNATSDVLKFFIGNNQSATPVGVPNNQGRLVDLDIDSNDRVYAIFANSNNEVTLNINTSGVWSADQFFPTISTTSNGYFHQIAVNETTDEVYFMYRENNGKLSILKFVPPSLPRIYVDIDAVGNGSGESWVDAFTDLTSAINAIQPGVTNEIWVAEGTYRTIVSGGTDGFTIATDGISIYGGFDGTESQLSERDVRINETIISGDANNNDGGFNFTTSSRNDNSDHVLRISGNNILIDGFSIADGHANGGGDHNNAGAIYVNDDVTGLTLRNCTIKDNVAYDGGGAIRWWSNQSSATINIENCIFDNNTSRWGSSIYFLTRNNASIEVVITNNLLINNRTINRGNDQGFSGDIWLRTTGTNSTLSGLLVNNTLSNFSSFGQGSGLSQPTAIGVSDRNGVSTVDIYNTISYGHQTNPGVSINGVGVVSTNNNSPATINVYNSIAEGGFSHATSATASSANDPLFTDVANNDFTLASGSPAINSGDNAALTLPGVSITNDLDFNQRLVDNTVDMGAFETATSLSNDGIHFDNNLKLYPNPVTSTLFIKTEFEIESVKILNLSRQVVSKSQNDKRLDVNGLPAGLYILQVTNTQNETSTLKFLKK